MTWSKSPYTIYSMKVVVLYRPNSEHGRAIDDFARDYSARYPEQRLELVSVDTRDGSATASLYDVFEYPTIMVLQVDGSVQHSWHGGQLPLIEEVAGYARA